MNIIYTKEVEIDEKYLRDTCIDAISDYVSDDLGISFVDDLASDVRRLIYAKVGALLIDYAGKGGNV